MGGKKMARVPVDLCQWVISCASGVREHVMMVVCGRKRGRACIIACAGGVGAYPYMCV